MLTDGIQQTLWFANLYAHENTGTTNKQAHNKTEMFEKFSDFITITSKFHTSDCYLKIIQ